jgi:NodT family efflux transporter outer membrane factor (OMF) lipoprotein
MNRILLPFLAATVLSGCSLAPPYHGVAPLSPPPGGWKTAEGWRPANPSDGAVRADWWTAFNDPTLSDLVARANLHNQTVAQAAATYRQAAAATREARASLFPTVSANGGVTHSYSGSGRVINGGVITGSTTGAGGSGTGTGIGGTGTSGGTGTGSGTTTGTTTGVISNGSSSTSYRLSLAASWQPDFFGQVLNNVRSQRYTQAARLADLANAQLTVQGELVSDYLSLRAADAQIATLSATVAAYRRSLQIASNRYNAGIAARTDQFQAQSQLASAQSDLEGEKRTRAQFEDAIAVLVGENPAGFRLAAVPTWQPLVPAVPDALPSTLVERRPDIAAAERAVAAANATIGVQRAAFFPTVPLSGSGGFQNESLSGLFSAGALLWSLGAQITETLLDFGGRSARVQQARAAYDAAVANYRGVTLTAFQDVQDNLIAQEILARQEALLRVASVAADRSEAALLNQYRSGIVIYTDVVTAQATALNARRSLIQAQVDRQNAAVALTQALGGGWSAADLAGQAATARVGAVTAAQPR